MKLAYRVREAAEAFGVSEKTIRRMIDEGTFRTRRRGRLILIPTGELERYLENRVPVGRPGLAARRMVDRALGNEG